jgi:hypothetical protein
VLRARSLQCQRLTGDRRRHPRRRRIAGAW